MKINGQSWRTIWLDDNGHSVSIIDQTLLPHVFRIVRLDSADDAARAIRSMQVRGAPLIGVTAAFGVALALRTDSSDAALEAVLALLHATRPTAVNLHWTLDRAAGVLRPLAASRRAEIALDLALRLAEEDVAINRAIGEHGADIIRAIATRHPGRTVNIATHCNAGWLGTVDYGTALAPIYRAHDEGIAVHVYVDETRPRLQGAALTAFELGQHGVPHTVIPDGASGHVIRTRGVDLAITGCDRVARNGDTANKIGTYMLALAAADNHVPFYVALPSRTVDLSLAAGHAIEIEERDEREVLSVSGRDGDGAITSLSIAAPGANAFNPAFDVTPARLVRAFITERGILAPADFGLLADDAA
ncbi:S-methyl-5-thioribose-1-phosphate isomerase [Rhizobium puerariae]|uniref:Methylthioribose-1-phosphate isomerase n=1 Tax=Rhizobium puerariae TaxID=1585791 RepID=A0ABV6ACM3_9HYPH